MESSLVRIVTVGSVDDGKSTLIGRLLYDSEALPLDHMQALQRSAGPVNLALITDGLRAEREANITIDVAYRYFSLGGRRFILADSPGHTQYTRNMVTACSTAQAALLLVDIENGVTAQTRRHAYIVSLLKVPRVLVVVNKMDLVGYEEERYQQIVRELREFVPGGAEFIPISALAGDNVVQPSTHMPWYHGGTVVEYLQQLVVNVQTARELRLSVQCVICPSADFRGYAGQVLSGRVGVGDEVMVLPAGTTTRVSGITMLGERADQACEGQPVIVETEDDLDISRGDLLVNPASPAQVSNHFEATVCWMGEAPSARKAYLMRLTTREVPCSIERVKHRVDVESYQPVEATQLTSNDIASVVLRTGSLVALDLFEDNLATGSLLLIDPDTHQTVAAGIVTRTQEPVVQTDLVAEAGVIPFRPGMVVWLTGLSGAGKTTLADLLKGGLANLGLASIQLDGDIVRGGICRDLGFSEEDRDENIRRVSEIAKLLSQQGFIVLCSFISPLRKHRAMAREIVGERFLEVFLECPLDEVMRRDPKGLYARATQGNLAQFTGVSAPYEVPEAPDVHFNTSEMAPQEELNELLKLLLTRL